jgi:acetyl esterase
MELIEAGFPRPGSMDPPEARRVQSEQLAALALEPEPVARVEDRTVPGPAGDVPVRVYWPEGEGPLPVIVYFHGGGWVMCGLDTHDASCRSLTNGVGAVVVSVDYRLAPEHRFPAAVDDCYAVTAWVAEHAAELGADPDRLAVAGDSAGGNLGAVVALVARDRGGPPLRFQLLVYPVIDGTMASASYRDNAEGYFLTADGMAWYWDQYVPAPADRSAPHASPIAAADLSGLPPALVVTAEYDPLRDEGEAYGRRLQEAGVPCDVRRYDGMFHGFFAVRDVLPAAKEANDVAHAALREALEA